MAASTFQGTGTRSSFDSATSVTPAITSTGITAGDLVFIEVGVRTNTTHSGSDSAWTKIDQITASTTWTSSLWVFKVPASLVIPPLTISWTGAAGGFAQSFSFERADLNPSETALQALGAYNSNFASTTPYTVSGVNAQAANALMAYIGSAQGNATYTNPATWTERIDNGSITGSSRNTVGTKTLTSAGEASGDVSIDRAAAAYVLRLVEIKEAVASGGATISPPVIASAATLYSPVISTAYAIAAPLLAASGGPNAPTVTTAISVSAPVIDSSAALYAPSLSTAYAINAPLISDGQAYPPAISTAIGIEAPFLAGSAALFAPGVASVLSLSPPMLDSAAQPFAPTVALTGQFLTVPIVAGGMSYAPAVQPGGVSVAAPVIVSGFAFLGAVIVQPTSTPPARRIVLPARNKLCVIPAQERRSGPAPQSRSVTP